MEQIEDIDRVCEVPTAGGFGDLVWSDPEEIEGWAPGSRGVGWLFGSRAVREFNALNWVRVVVRSHQLVESGHQWWFKERSLVTVWSAPNYCYRMGNKACVMRVSGEGEIDFAGFEEDGRSIESVHYSKLIPYFL